MNDRRSVQANARTPHFFISKRVARNVDPIGRTTQPNTLALSWIVIAVSGAAYLLYSHRYKRTTATESATAATHHTIARKIVRRSRHQPTPVLARAPMINATDSI